MSTKLSQAVEIKDAQLTSVKVDLGKQSATLTISIPISVALAHREQLGLWAWSEDMSLELTMKPKQLGLF